MDKQISFINQILTKIIAEDYLFLILVGIAIVIMSAFIIATIYEEYKNEP